LNDSNEQSPPESRHDEAPPHRDATSRGRSGWRARVFRIVRVAALAYVGIVIVAFSIQTWLIFPGSNTQGQAFAMVRPGPGTELVRLKTKEGEPIVALYGSALLPDSDVDPHAGSRPTMIFFYGNAMCMSYSSGQLEEFRRVGLNVIIPDYVGYGMSGGTPSERGCQATALAVYDYLTQERKVSAKEIIAAGWSLGGAVAIDLAAEREVGGLIAFSSFTSAVEMGQRAFPFLPVSILLRHRFDNIHKIAKVKCPTLVGHGRWDRMIPISMGEELAAKAGGPVTTLWIDEADHNDFFDVGGEQINQAIVKFVAGMQRGGP
jgi:fermentation-respiration switch protein FrsA (DUF1100 family)